MKEYISREAVMQMFADHVERSNNSDFVPTPTWNQAVQIVEDFPAADVVEVRHGQWNGVATGWECSVCTIVSNNTYPHCPYCGAVMYGGQVDD